MNHDIEDAVRAGIISENDVPWQIQYALGRTKSERITTFVTSLVEHSSDDIRMSPDIRKVYNELKEFLFESVYKNPKAKSEESKAQIMLTGLYRHFVATSASFRRNIFKSQKRRTPTAPSATTYRE
jgi:dGTPase